MKTILGAVSPATTNLPAATRYLGFSSNSTLVTNADEASSQVRFSKAGVISGFAFYWLRASASSSVVMTATLRVNGVDTLMTVTGTVNNQGRLISNEVVQIQAGDLVCLSITASHTLSQLYGVYAVFDDLTVDTCTQLIGATARPSVTWAGSEVVYYGSFAGNINFSQFNTEPRFQMKIVKDTTASQLFVTVKANPRVTDTVVRFRHNGADGNQLVTIGAGLTGQFLDSTNEDELEDGDTFNYAITTGAGTEALEIIHITTELETPDSSFFVGQVISSSSDTFSYPITVIARVPAHSFSGTLSANTTLRLPFSARISRFACNIVANTLSENMTIYLEALNELGANLQIIITVPAGQTGVFSNDVDEAIFPANISPVVTYSPTGGTGDVTYSWVAARVDEIFDRPGSPALGSPGVVSGADLSRVIKTNPTL